MPACPRSAMNGNWSTSFRDEEKVFTPRQRTIGVGLLAAGGRLHHVVANETKQLIDLDIRRREPLRNRDREWTVAAFAIERRLSMLCRIDYQRRAGHFHFAEA